MSLPHILMLGLITGASVGIVAFPPPLIGDLSDFTIDKFYCFDYSGSQRKLTKADFQFLRGVIRIREKERLRARRDRFYYNRIERQVARALASGRALGRT